VLQALNDKLERLDEDVNTPTTNIEELKFVLGVVFDMKDMALDVELEIKEIQESYRTLRVYGIRVLESQAALADGYIGDYASKEEAANAHDRMVFKFLKEARDHTGQRTEDYVKLLNFPPKTESADDGATVDADGKRGEGGDETKDGAVAVGAVVEGKEGKAGVENTTTEAVAGDAEPGPAVELTAQEAEEKAEAERVEWESKEHASKYPNGIQGVELNQASNKWVATVSYGMDKKWTQLSNWSRTRDLRLVQTKEEFREVTIKDVGIFAESNKVIQNDFVEKGPGSSFVDLEEGKELMAKYHKQMVAADATREVLVNAEKLFGLEYYSKVGYPELNAVKHELGRLDQIYGVYEQFEKFVERMGEMLWAQLDIQSLIQGTDDLELVLRKMPQELKDIATFGKVQDVIQAFKDGIPLIQSLKNDSLRPRHWQKLMKVTGVMFEMDPKRFTLENLFAMELHRFSSDIDEIVVEAMQEAKIEKEMKAIEEKWSSTSFHVAPYSKNGVSKGVTLCPAEDIKIELEDNLLNLQTMGGSRFALAYIDDIRSWEKKLNTVSDCIEVWFKVQSRWMYLESIFIGAEDIRQQLPEEAKRFDAIDKAWRNIMTVVSKNTNCVAACTTDDRTETLTDLGERLDKCQKSLSDYLDTKRNSFPRFFFISDDELLSILGTSDPTAIQQHLLKLFMNCKSFTFARGNAGVIGMESSEKEAYDFVDTAPVDGAVEVWMKGVEEEMKRSLRAISKAGVYHYAKVDRTEWVEQTLAMAGLLGSRIWWTWETEDAFRNVQNGDKYAMKVFLERQLSQLGDLVNTVRKKIKKHFRKKINTLLIIDNHAMGIIDEFVRDSILDPREFAWESQLRFYWDKGEDDAFIRQCTGQFGYGYEYYGLASCLVITPLTDRCYMTLSQALTFNLGGSPAGPAGTGKTETVKDLAKALGLPCFVINCGEGLDYKAMGNIFSGLCQIGAWGCFDEFNRINIEVLSVVASQIANITNSLNAGRATVDLGMGQEINLIKSVGIFITMNPGYAGRTELPDNLKAVFRPVTMIVPNLLQICEIMLFSEGFDGAKVLAKKMTTLYSLAAAQLSKQCHYDFKLRALKSVLVLAGGLKRENEGMPEDVVLMRALRDMNIPKFIFEDVPLFRGLISDLFPGLECPRESFVQLKDALEADLEENGLRHSDEALFQMQVDKGIQMYETFIVRHTTMVVGPTGGGKTTVLKSLQRSMMPAFNESVKIFTLNPKAQTLPELYGVMDNATRDWTDGILSKLFREMNQQLPPGRENEKRWLVYDGDVDALWIENMNSVMDDNRILTLPNGERIRLETHSMMIMETFDLQHASPATISRCGMVWVDPKNLGHRPYFEWWVNTRCTDKREEEKEQLLDMFERYVELMIAFVHEGIIDGEMGPRPDLVCPMTTIDQVKQLCTILDILLPPIEGEGSDDPVEADDSESLFVFSVVWSVGGALIGPARIKFDEVLRKAATCSLPGDGLLYDHQFESKDGVGWRSWASQVKEYVQPQPFEFASIMVPTADNTLYAYLLHLIMKAKKPCLLVGEPGTAKTVTIQHYLGALDNEVNLVLGVSMSSRTSAADVRNNINDKVDKRTGKIYGPPTGKKLTVFVDDMNMPKVDTYGTQQPIALLHYLVGRGCMYSQGKDLDLRQYKDMCWIGAMGPASGGRNKTDPRFVSLFNVFNLTPPTEAVLCKIFESILGQFLKPFNADMQEVGGKFTRATLRLYHHMQHSLPATPSKFHYIFNLRDLSKIYEVLCFATPDEMKNPGSLVRLWRNECVRVLRDRLINDEDYEVVNKELSIIMDENFGEHKDTAMADPLVYGDFRHAAMRIAEDAEDPRLYSDLGDYGDARRIFDEILESYNVDNKPMNLVLFEMAVEHLTRIHRIIRTPRGHAMLVGVGGSGKQSLAKLATFSAGYEIFEIVLSRGYGTNEFRDDLKELYAKAMKGPVTFLFTDAHVVDDGFLEMINNILTNGMVPALFESDEKDAMTGQLREEAAAAGIVQTSDNLWRFFLAKTRKNLHVVLAFSPTGSVLRVRCRNFPGLISNTTVDWFFAWPKQALQKVAQHLLSDETHIPDGNMVDVVEHMVNVHTSVMNASERFRTELRRNNYVTPKNYLDYIAGYRRVLKTKNKDTAAAIKRLQGGLTKLSEAGVAVDKMKTELAAAFVIVEASTVEVEALIVDIGGKKEIAGVQQESAAKKETKLNADAIVIDEQKTLAESSLAEAMPALEMAAKALEDLNKDDIVEIKGFNNPPTEVANVCLCVLMMRPLKGHPMKGGWAECRKMLGDLKFLDSLKSYEKDAIKPSQVKGVKVFFKDPDFTVENMRAKSKAGAGLLQWVVAIVKYYEVAKNVEPLRNKVRAMEKAQAEGSKDLAETKALLSTLSAELAILQTNFDKANGELTGLQTDAAIMEKRLNAAESLIIGLASEKTRWSADALGLASTQEQLVGDCVMAAAFLSYLGPFTFQYRQKLLGESWGPDIVEKKIPATNPFSVREMLTTDATVKQWNGEKLPGDDHSVQNGILTTQASRFPLCVDPQTQAVTWIKTREAKHKLTVKTFGDSDFMKHLELAIQFGLPFLFEAVDEDIDPMIDPILEKSTFMQGPQRMIKLGDKTVEWDDNFRMYMTSKLANPHYTPEIMGKVMIINYSVTMTGLAAQLLNDVVANERPDLEEQFRVLVDEMSANTVLQVQLEDNLLRELSQSEGNMLDNEVLIQTLAETKTKAMEISQKLEEANFTKEEIDRNRKSYMPVATRGSICFFAMSGLSNIMKMYETSLDSFLDVFRGALRTSKKDTNFEKRLRNMIDAATEAT
jgi:dynein heavy chain